MVIFTEIPLSITKLHSGSLLPTELNLSTQSKL